MKLRRFFLDINTYLDIDSHIKLDKELNNRLFNVLRLQDGSKLEFITRKEILTAIIKDHKITVVSKRNLNKPKYENILAVSLIDKNRFDTIVEKATELNLTKLIPIITERTKPFKNSEKLLDRWNRISTQALSQCYRTSLMEITNPMSFQEFISYSKNFKQHLKLIMSLRNNNIQINKLAHKNRLILIGPEGGFTEIEEQTAIKQQFIPVRVSNNTLRTETASISILGILEFLDLNNC